MKKVLININDYIETKLNSYSEMSGMDTTHIIRMALMEFIKNHELR